MAKMYDICVKVGSYQTSDGARKNKYETVGALMVGNDGREYISMKRTFNPAGVDVEPGRDSIILSLFEPRNQYANGNRAGQNDDDIPF